MTNYPLNVSSKDFDESPSYRIVNVELTDLELDLGEGIKDVILEASCSVANFETVEILEHVYYVLDDQGGSIVNYSDIAPNHLELLETEAIKEADNAIEELE